MKFIRLTSVFLCCALLSSFLILPASAADDDDYYSLPAVSDGSALVAPASLGGVVLAATGEYTSQLSLIISQQQAQTNYLSQFSSAFQSMNVWLGKIEGHTSNIKDYSSILSTISANVSTLSNKVATETTLSAFKALFPNFTTGFFYPNSGVSDPVYDRSLVQFLNSAFSVTQNGATGPGGANSPYNYGVGWYDSDNGAFKSAQYSFSGILATQLMYLTRDGKDFSNGYQWTLYHYVKQLAEVLAPDDDKKLAESQKENREQIENDFLTGKTGKTSLGKDDFSSLSSVGGTFKDAISLNGQSSIGDLTSGLSDADTVGQGWFSQATKDSLDVVSGSSSSESTVSTFSDDGSTSVDVDPDPYHMQGFEDNYAWLWGDD